MFSDYNGIKFKMELLEISNRMTTRCSPNGHAHNYRTRRSFQGNFKNALLNENETATYWNREDRAGAVGGEFIAPNSHISR